MDNKSYGRFAPKSDKNSILYSDLAVEWHIILCEQWLLTTSTSSVCSAHTKSFHPHRYYYYLWVKDGETEPKDSDSKCILNFVKRKIQGVHSIIIILFIRKL